MAVIGYIRLSPGERASARGNGNDQAFGADAQRGAITAWALAQGLPVGAWHEDIDIGGAVDIDKRPGLMAALTALAQGDVLCVAKRDRLARDVLNDALITRLAERKGATVASADGQGNGDDPASQAMRGMLAVFAEFERAMIATRIRAALAVKRERGEHMGPIPYGYRLDPARKVLVDHADEQLVIRAVLELHRAGKSLREISAVLADAEVSSPRGAATWMPSAVNALIRRESSANLQIPSPKG